MSGPLKRNSTPSERAGESQSAHQASSRGSDTSYRRPSRYSERHTDPDTHEHNNRYHNDYNTGHTHGPTDGRSVGPSNGYPNGSMQSGARERNAGDGFSQQIRTASTHAPASLYSTGQQIDPAQVADANFDLHRADLSSRLQASYEQRHRIYQPMTPRSTGGYRQAAGMTASPRDDSPCDDDVEDFQPLMVHYAEGFMERSSSTGHDTTEYTG